MFKRFTSILIALFILSVVLLIFSWSSNAGLEIYTSTPVTKVHRISQDLSGKWNKYSSLKQAWAREEILIETEGFLTGIKQTESTIIPSNIGLSVIAKQFRPAGQLGWRTAQLLLEGVYGEAKVYLNGIDDINYIGEVIGMGGTHNLEISPARFSLHQDNIIFIEFSRGTIQKEKLFGWVWPQQGRITGQIRLEAVPETTLDTSKLSFSYNTKAKQLIVKTVLNHHQNLDKEPWVINAVLKSSGEEVAECLLPVSSNGMYAQELDLIFDLPDPIFWSVDEPYLYDLHLSVINSRGDLDSVQIPLGINQFSKDSGYWLLNDRRLDVQGLVITQEDDYQIRNRQLMNDWLQKVKDDGFNLIYFMGFFPDESWLYAADQIGIAVWLELPVNMVPSKRIPDPIIYESLIAVNTRHPSVIAWTLAKGLEPLTDTEVYLKEASKMIPNKALYHLAYTDSGEVVGAAQNVLLTSDGFEGSWGRVQFNKHTYFDETNSPSWEEEKTAAIIWFIWICFISVQKLRASKWKYNELFNSSPKRAVREASFWHCLHLFSRMATLGGIITGILFRLPLNLPPWLPYNLDMISLLQNQNPIFIWLFLTMFFVVWRLLQVGVAAAAFPHIPSSLGLACWLERKYGWIFLVALAWILIFYGIPYYLPLIIYCLLSLIFTPVRIRDVWKIGGKYLYLALVPFTIATGVLLACLWYREDLFYVWFMIVPQIMQVLADVSLAEIVESFMEKLRLP